jgi:tetratricopeptide (TPR) repeat protein
LDPFFTSFRYPIQRQLLQKGGANAYYRLKSTFTSLAFVIPEVNPLMPMVKIGTMGLQYAMQQLQVDDSGEFGLLTDLIAKAVEKYHESDSTIDLGPAIASAQKLVAIIDKNSSVWAQQSANLSAVLIYRYQQNRAIDDLEQATSAARQAVIATPEDDAEYPDRVNNLGVVYNHRYELTGAMQDLERSIDLFRLATTTSTREHPDFSMWTNNLFYLLCICYEQAGRPGNIDEAIRLGKEAVVATPEGETGHPILLYNLGLAFDLRFRRTGIIDDLMQAIVCIRRAVDARLHSTNTDWLDKLEDLMEQLDKRFPIFPS